MEMKLNILMIMMNDFISTILLMEYNIPLNQRRVVALNLDFIPEKTSLMEPHKQSALIEIIIVSQ